MTSIAEFTLAATEFPLGRVFEDRPRVTMDLDRVVPSGDTVMPHFWVQDPDCDMDGIQSVFAELPELRDAVLMEDLGERGLFRAEWDPEYIGIMGAVAETGVTVLSASGSSEGWLFELRATSAEQFSAFQQHCTDSGIDVTLARLSHLTEEGGSRAEYGLTPEQREALLQAYAGGYYDEPRRTDQETLAAQLDITRQALSSRLRRGYRNLLEHTIVRTPDERP